MIQEYKSKKRGEGKMGRGVNEMYNLVNKHNFKTYPIFLVLTVRYIFRSV